MRSITRITSLFLAILFVPILAASAQSAEPSSEGMTLHVTADSKAGTPVEDLTKDDFTLTDNRHPAPITGFRAVKDAQTRVIIVLDAVNLPYSFLSYARQQLSHFLGSNDGRLPQPTTLAVLQDIGMQVLPRFTTNGNELRSALDKFSIGLRDVRRSAGVYGAEEQLQISLSALDELMLKSGSSGPTRIIWISPGWPLLSGPGIDLSSSQSSLAFHNIVALTTELHRTHTVIDDVNPVGAAADVARTFYYESFLQAPRNEGSVQLGQLGLQVLSTQSGGLVLNGSNDISGLIQRVYDQTRDGYELTFPPAPGERENEYHQLTLKVRRSGVTLHTTAGYYARPVFPPLAPTAATPNLR